VVQLQGVLRSTAPKERRGIRDQHLLAARLRLSLPEDKDAGSEASTVEEVRREADHGFD